MDFLSKLLFYSPDSPMLFTHLSFWVFFPVVLLCYSSLYKTRKKKIIFLLACSFFFYYKSGGLFVLLLLFTTLLNYFIGLGLGKSEKPTMRKLFVSLGVILNLSILGYFKYTYFFVGLLNDYILKTPLSIGDPMAMAVNNLFGTEFSVENIVLPVGISFYIFQAISYLVDLYRRETSVSNKFLDFAFYLSFFPQLVAGPIVRANEFMPQIAQPYNVSQAEFSRGLYLILNGLVKKICIADYLSVNFVDRIFDMPQSYSGLEHLLGIYGYTLQIYCDFSGYTDIAIGIALWMGYRLPLNFRSPYKANNITDFWRRWHLSLSRWLRDYLYIPLGGNRKGKLRQYLNLFITMFLGGLWHGAHLRFILWGSLHGMGLIVHKTWVQNTSKFSSTNTISKGIKRFVGIFITFHFVAFCWVFFRAESMDKVLIIFRQIFHNPHFELWGALVSGYGKIFVVLVIGYLIHWIPETWKSAAIRCFTKVPWYLKVLSAVAVVVLLYQMRSAAIQPFIYFQF